MSKFPARLHVVMARKAPVAVVFRRGPANAVCTVGWDRSKDKFKRGQWLRGKIYERRADISPDGTYLIYFARGNGAKRYAETKGSWTAISRAPWMKAITLWGKGDCWQGGGLFTSETKYWLNGCHFPVRESREVKIDQKYRPPGGFGAECLSVYFPRLLRDGWVLQAEIGPHRACVIFEKPLLHGWVLRKFAYADVQHPLGSGCYWDEHELEHTGRKALLSVPAWEWAERDGEALVWAEKGVLYRALVDAAGPADAKALYDFNPMQFEARPAPY